MSFLVESGAGDVGSNAYIEVAFADSYHSLRNRDDWTGSDTQKQAAIVKATDFIDNFYRFQGIIGDVTQGLQWPRDYVYDECGDAIEGVPDRVKQACAEYARIALKLELVREPDGSPDGSIVRTRERTAEFEEEVQYAGAADRTLRRYAIPDRILYPLTLAARGPLRV